VANAFETLNWTQEPRMRTRSEAARANGAKSRGPTTPAGKQKSSRNALSHGFTAHSTIILKCENPEEFEQMVADYRATYQPATAAESQLVDQMIAARWRIRRLWTIETALLDSEIHRRQQEHADPDSAVELAEAFRTLADDSRSLHLISRYESRLHRIHGQAHEALRELQNKKCETNPSPPDPQQNKQVPPPETHPDLTHKIHLDLAKPIHKIQPNLTNEPIPISPNKSKPDHKIHPRLPKEQTETVGRAILPAGFPAGSPKRHPA